MITVFSQALGAVINGLLITLLARKLSENDFGIYITTVSLVTVLGSFTLGIRTVTARDFTLSRDRATNGIEVFHGIQNLVVIFAGLWLATGPLIHSTLQIPAIYLLIATLILVASVLGSYATGVLQGLRRFEFWQKLILFTTIIQIPLILFPVGRQLGVGYFLTILSVPSFCLFLFTFLVTRHTLVRPSVRFARTAINEGLSLGAVTLMLQGPTFSARLIDDPSSSVTTASIGLFFLSLCGLSSTMGSYLLPDHVLKSDVTFSKTMLMPHLIHTLPLLLAGSGLVIFGQNLLSIMFGDKISFTVSRPVMALIVASYAIWSVGQSFLNSCISSLKSNLPYLLLALALLETLLLFLFRHSVGLFYVSFGIVGLFFLVCVLASFKKITENS